MALGMKSVDIGKSASAAKLVFEAVRKAIIEGELREGEPLRQDELARLFNTSRIPVREALTILEQQGLVKTERFKGSVVAGHSLEEASEIFDFRALLETEVIRQAVPNMTPETLETARAVIERFSSASDPMMYGDLNREFHETLYRASGLTYHMGLIVNSLDRIDRYLRAQLVISEGTKRATREHLDILAACERGNAELASQITAEHILGAKQSLVRHIQAVTKG
ncbi:transcriptional regulator, GntR family [Shimia gijangensis]|uniref:Transcriptional regulator, GntR family n=1 Tax=Shimia gijangensis TaxID=1470563 RepID=A0A1M6LUP8_9RHOB|nr:GntR family transcriptional regulator [Shimia gijangensis]SHJ74900.1 transcriptional regulator, GntR family [Shimia gijangensis]